MHPLHEHLARQLTERLQKRQIVVVYDPRGELGPFFDRDLPLDDDCSELPGLVRVRVGELAAHLARYDGSFFGLRAAVEPIAGQDRPDPLLLYLPGVKRDHEASPLMELERAGEVYEAQLRRLSRDLLRRRFTDGQIDEVLDHPNLTYDDVAALFRKDENGGEPLSVLRTLFDGSPSEPLLARWLADDASDEAITAKGATGELARLIESRLGLTLPGNADVADARARAARYLLVAELRADLDGDPPSEVSLVPTPPTKDHLAHVRDVLRLLRRDHANAYVALADRVEGELGLANATVDPARLGAIDTFRFEERRLLDRAAELIVAKRFDAAIAIVTERRHSFWVDQDLGRQAQWEACRLMAALGGEVERIVPTLGRVGADPAAWVATYSAEDGWHRADGLQRELESWIARMDDDLDDASARALVVVRREHDELLKRTAEGFARAFRQAGWTFRGVLHQTRIYPDAVKAAAGRTAYVFVDALRYEMGVALARLLEGSPDLAVRPAVAALPTITPVGMAALLPGAAASFSVVEQRGKLAARIDATAMTNLADRQKALEARVPGVVDLTLFEVLQRSPTALAKKIGAAPLVVVRSQEIDMMGELDADVLARRVMDTVVADLARAVKKLAAAGAARFVISADHGHLFSLRREEDMRTDTPGGDTVDLHRRCWIGRGGATPAGTVRVSGAELGYDTDLEFVFPIGLGVFKAGGGLSYHHGGISLQELVVPVVSLRAAMAATPTTVGRRVHLEDVPTNVVTRTFGVRVVLEADLFSTDPVVLRPILVSGAQQVGSAGMAVGADLDPATNVVRVAPGSQVMLGFLLRRDDVESLRIVLQDPSTDGVLAQSDEIPVKLGM